MSGLGKWIENILSSCSPKSVRPSIKFRGINLLRCEAYTWLTVRCVGGDGPFSHCLMKKGGGREVGLKNLLSWEIYKTIAVHRMCQLMCALTAVTDTSDVLRLSSEKQRIMHIVSSERLVVCVKYDGSWAICIKSRVKKL